MTEDYKEKLLRYFTNNLEEETGIDEPEFTRQNPILKEDIISMLDERFPYGHYQTGVVSCKNSTGEYNGYTVVYGYYHTQTTPSLSYQNRKGYILLFDENMNLLQLITEFSSGTPLNHIEKMKVDEEGNFYGVDMVYDENTSTGVRNRFIMLNNISLKLPIEDTYKIVLRQSYYLQGSTPFQTFPTYISVINKDLNGANYIFYSGFEALTLKINVGSENEWKQYNYQPTSSELQINSIIPIYSIFSYWDNEDKLTLCTYTIGHKNNEEQVLERMWKM